MRRSGGRRTSNGRLRVRWLALALLALAGAALAAGVGPVVAGAAPRASLTGDFSAAAREYRVPRPLLMAMGYVDTHWRTPPGPSVDGGWGVMHLVENPSAHTLGAAARLVGLPAGRLQGDRRANIRGGAALLADAAGPTRPRSLAGWYAAVARVGGGRQYADQVYATLASGASATVSGERVVLPAESGLGAVGAGASARAAATRPGADYGRAVWAPASPQNYRAADRPTSSPIDTIVIHVTESSWSSAVNWFQNPAARASAHYIVRSRDGAIAQSVHESDIAYHSGNWAYNVRSVGIEHEAFTSDCSWYTDAMYRSSARLAAYLVKRYGIPIDRRHFIGHSEVPDPNNPRLGGGADHHTDPGTCWNWRKYLAMVREEAAYHQVVDDASPTRFSASASWRRGSANPQRYGAGYRLASPSRRSADPARFKLRVPHTGRYAVSAWRPASSTFSSSAPVGIQTSTGLQWLRMDERTGGGRWVALGTFSLNAGDDWYVSFSRRTRARGAVVADAVKIVER